MTLLFMDSFDHYSTAHILQKWTVIGAGSPSISSGWGRFGTNCMNITGSDSVTKTLAVNATTLICGFAVKFAGYGAQHGSIVAFLDSGSIQMQVRHSTTSGLFEICRGTTVLATTAIPLYSNVWYYFEFKVLHHNSTGTAELRVNNTSYASVSGVDTTATANAYSNQVRIGPAAAYSPQELVDDFYVCDGQGAVNNDFLNDHRVECLFPSGAGANADWTPTGAATNYECVDETSPNDDTDYNAQDDTGLPETDTFAMTDLASTTGTIAGTQSVLRIRKDDAGVVTVCPVYRVAGTDYPQTGVNVPDTYQYQLEIEETNPDTGVAWLIAGVNAIEFGYRRTA